MIPPFFLYICALDRHRMVKLTGKLSLLSEIEIELNQNQGHLSLPTWSESVFLVVMSVQSRYYPISSRSAWVEFEIDWRADEKICFSLSSVAISVRNELERYPSGRWMNALPRKLKLPGKVADELVWKRTEEKVKISLIIHLTQLEVSHGRNVTVEFGVKSTIKSCQGSRNVNGGELTQNVMRSGWDGDGESFGIGKWISRSDKFSFGGMPPSDRRL